MSEQRVPGAGALTAHVRTAVDGTLRWLDRGLRSGPGDVDGWDRATFYARMMLMRGLEQGELLGWVLERDAQAERGTERGAALRAGTAYWSEARRDLHDGIAVLRRAADADPTQARQQVLDARDRLRAGADWLLQVAEGLGRLSPAVEPDARYRVAHERSDALDLDAM
jgi:hypothetical protein